MVFEIKPVRHSQMTWEIRADGKVIRPRLLEFWSEWGHLRLGLRPEGFHGWAYKPGKGCVLTIPWSRTPVGEILVGMIHENRPNIEGGVWSVPGGAVDAGESHEQAARRETAEEAGIDTKGAAKLPGVDVNADRMLYIMSEGDEWGMRAYALEIPTRLLELSEGGRWLPKGGLIKHAKECELVFMPWREAILLSADALALSAIARLLREVL